MAFLILTVAAGVAAQNIPVRELQASVTLDRMSGSIRDVVDRVDFTLSGDYVNLSDVWFNRQPHSLSDGVALLQTHPFESEVFVRQIVEHPRAEKTVVIFPGLAVGHASVLSRFLVMAEIAALNPGKELQAVGETQDGAVTRYYLGEFVPVTSAEAALVAGVESHAPATVLFSAFAGLATEQRLGAANTADDGQIPEPVAQTVPPGIESLMEEDNHVLLALLDGQGLLVVEQIELAIRRTVDESPELGSSEIGELNALQNQLAVVLGWSDLRGVIFEDGNSAALEAVGVLRKIDRLIGSATERIFHDGRESIRRLFLRDIPATVQLMETDPSTTPAEDPSSSASELGREALFSIVTEAPAGSLILMEASEDRLYDLIRLSMEESTFNLVIMSNAVEQEPAKDPAASANLAADRFTRSELVVHPSIDTNVSNEVRAEFARWAVTEEVRLAEAASSLRPDSAIVTQRQIMGKASLIGLAVRQDSGRPETGFYLLPGVHPREISAAIASLISGSAELNPLEEAVLSRWAIVAQTAIDL